MIQTAAGSWRTTSADHLINRPLQTAPCDQCGTHLLVAIVGGITAYVDMQALSVNAEIAAILCGRLTFDIMPDGMRKAYLADRDIFRIRGERKYSVVASHQCATGRRPSMGWRLPAERQSVPTPKPAPVIRDNDKVPF